MTAKRVCPECGHFWTQHDIYGCSVWSLGGACECTRIDQDTRFDRATRRAVTTGTEGSDNIDDRMEP